MRKWLEEVFIVIIVKNPCFKIQRTAHFLMKGV